jgi:hypothetical protein
MTSETFGTLFQKFALKAGFPNAVSWPGQWTRRILALFHSPRTQRTAYDQFMLRFNHLLKVSEEFQDRSPRRFWTFPSGTAWLLFSDGLSHAVLRGQFALEHSFFVHPSTLVLPEESPAQIFRQACQKSLQNLAA